MSETLTSIISDLRVNAAIRREGTSNILANRLAEQEELIADRLDALLVSCAPLSTFMAAKTTPERDAAFLALCAEHLRNGTFATWEIPNTIASTLRDISQRLVSCAPVTGQEPGTVWTAEELAEVKRRARERAKKFRIPVREPEPS